MDLLEHSPHEAFGRAIMVTKRLVEALGIPGVFERLLSDSVLAAGDPSSDSGGLLPLSRILALTLVGACEVVPSSEAIWKIGTGKCCGFTGESFWFRVRISNVRTQRSERVYLQHRHLC